MSYLSEDVLRALDDARSVVASRLGNLRLHLDGGVYPISRLLSGGFAIALKDAPRLRGSADIFDGSRHLSSGVIVASRSENGEWIYDFRLNINTNAAPALDYIRDDSSAAVTATSRAQ